MKAPRIVVVGSSNTDMVVKSNRIPHPGETVTGGQYFSAPGGKGANQAVAAARLGADVTLVARVGSDLLGEQAVEGYRNEGIRVDHVLRSPGVATGVALILVDAAGENSISVASGANHCLTAEDIQGVATTIREAEVLMLQLEVPFEAVREAARIAHAAGVLVVLDPAPTPVKSLEAELLECIDYLTPNESEASRLSGIEVRDRRSAYEAAARLRRMGPRCVIVTLGAAGVVMNTADGQEGVEGFVVESADSTAAGDAFNAGLARALGAGLALQQAVREACACGALAATKLGAQPSLPRIEELKVFLQSTAD